MHMQYSEYEYWTFEQWEALPLTDDDLMYHLDSLTSAFSSSSLHDMDQEEETTFFDSVSDIGDVVQDV